MEPYILLWVRVHHSFFLEPHVPTYGGEKPIVLAIFLTTVRQTVLQPQVTPGFLLVHHRQIKIWAGLNGVLIWGWQCHRFPRYFEDFFDFQKLPEPSSYEVHRVSGTLDWGDLVKIYHQPAASENQHLLHLFLSFLGYLPTLKKEVSQDPILMLNPQSGRVTIPSTRQRPKIIPLKCLL